MAKFAADKTQIFLTATDAVAPTPAAITGITAADPAVLSPYLTGAAVGDMVKLTDTGDADLDGKFFAITAIAPATSVTLDVDRTGKTAIATGNASLYNLGTDLIHVCMANLTMQTGDPTTIDTGDLCGPGTLLGSTPPPTFDYTGFADPESAGFKNWVEAALESPKKDRTLMIQFPGDNGYIAGPAAVGSFSTGATTGEAVQISGSGTFTEMPTISWIL